MKELRLAMAMLAAVVALVDCQAKIEQSSGPAAYVAPSEFEPQEYIWLTWVEWGWLGGSPLAEASLEALRVITPHARVRLLFSALAADDSAFFPPHRRSPAEAKERLRTRLRQESIDLSRSETELP